MGHTVLVTGASGFAGIHLLEHLRATRDVVGWSRGAPATPLPAGVSWERIDLTRRDNVREALLRLKPSEVYHCAGAAQVDRSWVSTAEPLSANALATHYLLDGLRRIGRPCRVLVTGSAMVYAASSDPLTESSPLAPDSPYAVSKLAQEMLSIRAGVEDGLAVIVTRSFNHTGPRQMPSFVASGFARQLALIEKGQQDPVVRVGNLDARRDIADVRDVVRAYSALMARGVPGEIYNVASGAGHTVGALLDTLISVARVGVRVETDPARVRPIDKPSLVGDISKLTAATGWTPEVTFTRMLTDLLEYWRATV